MISSGESASRTPSLTSRTQRFLLSTGFSGTSRISGSADTPRSRAALSPRARVYGSPGSRSSPHLACFTCNLALDSLRVITCFLTCNTCKKSWFTCKTWICFQTVLQISTICHFHKIFAKFRQHFIKIEH